MDDYDDLADARVRGKNIQRSRDDGTAADLAVLLRPFGLASAFAASGRDDHHGDLFVCRHCYVPFASPAQRLSRGQLGWPVLSQICLVVGILRCAKPFACLMNGQVEKLLGFCA